MPNMTMLKALTSLFCACLIAPLATTAANSAQDLGLHVEWRSETRDGNELALALERLYVVLYNTGNLRTQTINDPKDTGRVVVEILRSHGLFYGEFLPAGVDAVMCDLNPEVCKRARTAVADNELGQISDQVGGYKKSQGRWSNGVSTALRIPDIQFEQYVTIAEVPYRKGENLEETARTAQVDCTQFGAPCDEVVKRLNRSLFDPKRDQSRSVFTQLRVPVQGLKTTLVLRGAEGSNVQRATRSLFISRFQEVEASPDWQTEFSPAYQHFLRDKSPADLAFNALKDKLLSFGTSTLQSVDDPLFREERPLLELIHHPLATSNAFDEALQQPIPVAVFDTRFDKNHCELKDSVETDDSLSGQPRPASDLPDPAQCGSLRDDVSVAEDHGTHVAGLIAASINQQGVVGLDPYAKVKYVALDATSLQGPEYRARVADKMRDHLIKEENPIKITNISWQYGNQTNLDTIKKTIENLKENILFVVAAGNSNKELSENGCSDYPACFGDLPNVIVVAGLDRSNAPPKLWRKGSDLGSNWGRMVALGAVADNVLSTTYHSYTGRMSGTSQAAPQVTAAASLLYSVYKTHHEIDSPDLLPIRIKNRLIYTSDLFNELLTKTQGGRLNIDRALETALDQVQITTNNEVKTYKGKISKFGNFPAGGEYIECRLGNGKALAIQYGALRRMHFDPFRKKYIVFYNSPGRYSEMRDNPLLRITDCDLTTQTHEVAFQPEAGPEIRFQFRDIQDYVSRMF